MSFEEEFKLEHAWVEFKDRLQMIADRRGLTLSQVTQEALGNFVSEDFAKPRSTNDDIKLGLPAGEPIIEEVKLHRYSAINWPDADNCSDEEVERWLGLIQEDMFQIKILGEKDALELDRVLNKYRNMESRLRKRLKAQDK